MQAVSICQLEKTKEKIRKGMEEGVLTVSLFRWKTIKQFFFFNLNWGGRRGMGLKQYAEFIVKKEKTVVRHQETEKQTNAVLHCQWNVVSQS